MADRLMFFNKKFPIGCIRTEQVEMLGRPFYRAIVTPDIANPARYFTGHAPAVTETGAIFRKTCLLAGAEESVVALALSLVVSGEAGQEANDQSHEPKTDGCQECGRIWRKTEDDESGLLGICPECRIKKRPYPQGIK